jgi:hypothetical protein
MYGIAPVFQCTNCMGTGFMPEQPLEAQAPRDSRSELDYYRQEDWIWQAAESIVTHADISGNTWAQAVCSVRRIIEGLAPKDVEKDAQLSASLALGTKQAETECRMGARIVELLNLRTQLAEALREVVAELSTATQLSPGCQNQVDSALLADRNLDLDQSKHEQRTKPCTNPECRGNWWVNIEINYQGKELAYLYPTRDSADKNASDRRVACVHFHWEKGEGMAAPDPGCAFLTPKDQANAEALDKLADIAKEYPEFIDQVARPKTVAEHARGESLTTLVPTPGIEMHFKCQKHGLKAMRCCESATPINDAPTSPKTLCDIYAEAIPKHPHKVTIVWEDGLQAVADHAVREALCREGGIPLDEFAEAGWSHARCLEASLAAAQARAESAESYIEGLCESAGVNSSQFPAWVMRKVIPFTGDPEALSLRAESAERDADRLAEALKDAKDCIRSVMASAGDKWMTCCDIDKAIALHASSKGSK